jgi:hypothetical protein
MLLFNLQDSANSGPNIVKMLIVGGIGFYFYGQKLHSRRKDEHVTNCETVTCPDQVERVARRCS